MKKDYAEMQPSGLVRRIGGLPYFEIEHREDIWPIVVTESLWRRHFAPFSDQVTLACQRASYLRGLELAMKLMDEFPQKSGRSPSFWTQVEELGAFHADLTEDDTGDGVTVIAEDCQRAWTWDLPPDLAEPETDNNERSE